MTIEDLTRIFDEITIQARRYHWQTESFAEHEALGEFYGTWNDLADKFVETYAGIYGRPKGDSTVRAVAYEPGRMTPWIQSIVAILDSQNLRSIAPDTALQNILDELSGAARQTAYLLTMKK
jgi:hypothetical protein